MNWLLGLTSILMVSFQGPSTLVEFKQIEYDLSIVYGSGVYEKCDIPLSSIAYAFAIKESGNGNGHKQANKNNLFGLRNGKSTTVARPKFADYPIKTYTPNGYNVYDTRYDSIYDFMNQFYTRGCVLSKTYVRGHLNGPNGGRGGVDEYYSFIKGYANDFTMKANAEVFQRALLKPKSLIGFYNNVMELDKNGFTHNATGSHLRTGSTIVIDTRLKQYMANFPM